MSNNGNEAFYLQEVTLHNSNLLPEDKRWVLYFVTALQGENKKIIFIGFTHNLREKFKNHSRKLEFEFLDRMGYQINISWVVFPGGTLEKEVHAALKCYKRAFEPKLNDERNTISMLLAEETKKAQEKWEQEQYGYVHEQIETWQQTGDDQDTVIRKMWEAIKERLIVHS
jgi:hypothetical protein